MESQDSKNPFLFGAVNHGLSVSQLIVSGAGALRGEHTNGTRFFVLYNTYKHYNNTTETRKKGN